MYMALSTEKIICAFKYEKVYQYKYTGYISQQPRMTIKLCDN